MRYALLLVPFLVAACATPDTVSDPNGVALEDVIHRIKLEVGLYQQYEKLSYKAPPKDNACKGYVNFRITKVKVTLQTIRLTNVAADASIGASFPTGYKLGLSAGGHHITKNTATMILSMFPGAPEPHPSPDFDKESAMLKDDAPLYSALVGLRTAILKESDLEPCLPLRLDDKSVANTASFAFQIENTGTAGFAFTYTIFSVDASRATDNTNTSTIEVTFEPYLNPLVNGKKPETPAIPRGKSGEQGVVF